MRIIVNKNQYNKLLKHNKEESQLYEEWSNFILDKIEVHRNSNILTEEIVCERNLKIKLKGKPFFNDLPINNLILNIFETKNVERCDYPTNTFIMENKEVELDIFIRKEGTTNTLKNSIMKEFFKIRKDYENSNK